MFLGRSCFGNPFFKALQLKQQQQQRHISEQRRRQVPLEIRARSSNNITASTTTDLKRPPLLLVKSFYNLRHRESDDGRDVAQVTDELSFRPHRTIFIEILQMPIERPAGADSYAKMRDMDMDMDTDMDTIDPDMVRPHPVSES